MKICRITDEYPDGAGEIGYLFYYEKARRFYIEIAEDLDYWHAPMILDSYIKRGVRYVDAPWSLRWVENRIIPRDRQNIASILLDAGLDEYDEYRLLIYSCGRCAQDDCMVEEIREEEIPPYIKKRWDKHVSAVFPLQSNQVITFFNDNTSCINDISLLMGGDRRFSRILTSRDVFLNVRVSEGGYGICWDEEREIPYYQLRKTNCDYALCYHDMQFIIEHETMDTAQAAERLNCTRQNIDDLVRRGKLHPVKTGARNKLFIKNEVEERLW